LTYNNSVETHQVLGWIILVIYGRWPWTYLPYNLVSPCKQTSRLI